MIRQIPLCLIIPIQIPAYIQLNWWLTVALRVPILQLHRLKYFLVFSTSGVCATKPSNFTDRTTATSGVVDSWKWDFGNNSTTTDISSLQNPNYSYPSTGTFNARLIV